MNYLVFDTETTGLIDNVTVGDSELPEVIEFFGVLIDQDGNKIKEYEQLIRPKKPIPKEITKITGIDDAMVRLEPSFDIVCCEIFKLIEESPAVVAHNLNYDVEMLNIEARRLGKTINWPATKICTIEQTMHIKGHRMNLGALYEYLFGSHFAGAHRARADVEALARCVVELIKREEL